MAVTQRLIDSFLDAETAEPLAVKGKTPAALDALICELGELPRFKTPHRQQQHEALAFALFNRRALLFYEMRTGKTKISLDWLTFLIFNRQVRKALIIAHAPVAIGTWEAEIARHSHLWVRSVVSGKGAHEAFCDAVDDEKVDAILITWSTLQALFSVRKVNQKGRSLLVADIPLLKIAAESFDAVIIDEIHMAMDPETLRFDIASTLVSRCDWRLGLTGTPVGRSPFGLWAQFYLIDGGVRLGRGYRFFQQATGKRVANRFNYSGWEWGFDKRYLPLLRDKIKDIILECELREMQEVNVIKSVIPLRMAGEQLRAYREVIEEIKRYHAGETYKMENAFIRCRQIASGWRPFTNDEGEERIRDFSNSAKFDWMEDLVVNIGPDIKVIIFHEYTHTGARLCSLLAKHKVKHDWLYGGTKDRTATIAGFQEGATQFLVANAATGGTGTNLSAADYLCYFESPPGVITRKQSEFRPLARGSRPLVIDDLVCSPIEQRILDFHAEGSELSKLLRRSPSDIARALSV